MTDRLTASQLKVLLAVCVLHRRGPVTVRAVAAYCGWEGNTHWADLVLNKLRRLGLVTWELGKAGTLRPNCTVTVGEVL